MPKTDFNPILYAINVQDFTDEKLFCEAYNYVNDFRKEKINRFRFPKDKYLSLGAGLLLEYALKKAEVPFGDIVIGDNGKPFFKDNRVFFSVSHSEDIAICAVAPFEIGCDVEFKEPPNLEIANRFFSGEEYADIISSPDGADKFYRYWTLKESFMKATGLGMKIPLHSFMISLKNGITITQSVNEKPYFFKEFTEIKGYGCAVCCTQNCDTTEFRFVTAKEILAEASL